MVEPWYVTFQPALSAAVGFAGVIATLIWNSYLQREGERLKSVREEETVRAALIGELKVIREALDNAREQAAASFEETETLMIDLSVFNCDIFQSHVNRLGTLPPNIAENAVETYQMIKQLKNLLPHVANGQMHGDMLIARPSSYPEIVRLAEANRPRVHSLITDLEH